MKICLPERRGKLALWRAFTLIEVSFSMALAAFVCAAIMKCYTIASHRSFYAAGSLAANSQAMKQLETIIYASWKPSAGITNILTPSLTNPAMTNLEMPVVLTNITCTNYITITTNKTSYPYPWLMIRVDCIWTFSGYGPFTNTVCSMRGPDF
jgi:type II secretory pathway pseudopilin PulG